MLSNWQDIVAFSVVGGAAVYLAWRAWPTRSVSTTAGCAGGCYRCPGASPPAADQTPGPAEIIPIETLGSPAARIPQRD